MSLEAMVHGGDTGVSPRHSFIEGPSGMPSTLSGMLDGYNSSSEEEEEVDPRQTAPHNFLGARTKVHIESVHG